MSITISNLKAWYGNSEVLKDINVDFKPRTVTAIVGPSGCGKTTLLRSINRTAELAHSYRCGGDIRLDNESIFQQKNVDNIRRRIGMVLQTPVALPLSIKENVIFGTRYHGGKNKTELNALAEKCLKQAGLWTEVEHKLNCPASELSGGQKQRLSIARVLAVEPEVLLLDEPCSSLDPASTQIIEGLLVDLAKELTVILVTHNLFQAKRVAAETIFMMDGRVIEQGLTAKLFDQPQQPETAAFFNGLTW
ncbi:phosphate ABC transporter ATP-binding protein [Peptococcaceae bacterium 1198_IL3148]